MSKSAIFVVSGFLAFLLYALLLYGLLLERHNKEAEKILLDLGKKNEQVIDLNLEDLPSDEKKDEKIAEKAEEKKDEKAVEKNATDKEAILLILKNKKKALKIFFLHSMIFKKRQTQTLKKMIKKMSKKKSKGV